MSDSRVRIVVKWQGQDYFFIRMNGASPLIAPQERARTAALLSREIAVTVCRYLRSHKWDARIVTPSGVTLFEDAMNSAEPQAPMSERDAIPMHVGAVLIVPGQPPRRGWFIRFPATAYESLWGPTPEAAYQRLIEHPMSGELLQHAEKYITPEELVDPREIERAIQRERYGNRRLRPGSI